MTGCFVIDYITTQKCVVLMWVEHCLRATSLPPFPFFVCVVFKLYILQDCYRYFGDESDFKEKILVC